MVDVSGGIEVFTNGPRAKPFLALATASDQQAMSHTMDRDFQGIAHVEWNASMA